MELTFSPGREGQLDAVFALYRSAVDRPFCAWDAEYPGWQELRRDWETGNLYVLTQGDRLLGALSVVPDNELDDLPGWRICGAEAREIARVVVAEEARGRGLAQYMVEEICNILKARGCRSLHLSAARNNAPAVQVYRHCGFTAAGSAQLYGGTYLLMEKIL